MGVQVRENVIIGKKEDASSRAEEKGESGREYEVQSGRIIREEELYFTKNKIKWVQQDCVQVQKYK